MKISEHDLDGVKVLAVEGKITKGEAERMLRDHLHELEERGHTKIVVNLGGVSYIDSSGLGELVRGYTSLRRAGGRLCLTQLNARLVDLLNLTKLSDIFETYATDADAVASLGR
jgi:anti-sigma B factor antagonist